MSSSAANSEWSYVWATRADLADVQQYIHTHWQPGHLLSRDMEFLKWQYQYDRRDTPEPGQSGIILAKRGSTIGGMLGIIANDCTDHGRAVTAGWYAIWSVASEYRQFGLGLGLLEKAKQHGYQVVGTLGANKLAMNMYRLLRYQLVPAMLRSVRLFSWPLLAELLESCKPEDKLRYQVYWHAREKPPAFSSADSSVSVQQALAADLQDWDELWGTEFAPQLFSVDRTSAYLRARYLDHPVFQYKVLLARDARGKLAGLCVYRIGELQSTPLKMLRTVEFLAVDADAYAALSRQLEIVAAEDVCVYADFNCTLREAHAGLAGFQLDSGSDPVLPKRLSPVEFTKSATSVVWNFLDPAGRSLDPETEVYLTSADGDQDRPN